MIRVLIAEDHTLVRSALEKLLAASGDIEVVGAAANGREAVELAATARPDVVLMDLSMPELDGVQATRAIVAAGGAAQVVVLTSLAEPERVLAALDAGAVGYLLKDAEPDEVIAGVHAAARGGSPLSPKAARAVLTARAAHERADLTERERDVLRCVAGGLPNKLIARELGISEKTVKAHLTRVFQQIGVSDRTQAALWAKRNGLG